MFSYYLRFFLLLCFHHFSASTAWNKIADTPMQPANSCQLSGWVLNKALAAGK